MPIFGIHPADSAKYFFSLIVVLGVVSIGAIVFLSTYGMQKTITSQIATDAQDDAVHVAQALLETYSDLILQHSAENQLFQVYVEHSQSEDFDRTIRRFFAAL